ncbi:hypothetical protein FJ970_14345 [Mesorhizobium sp. B2-1-8]|uniref:hypothetical protein n=1 Tax=unclassified Mesorhizobium TaxID=325217 RepID=UPI001129938D|nr:MULTISPECIES: hypothetical protein [unclassified Mesorhizobium]MBZ9670752.1 hypothetical protein [Mesorhizobium sp. ES1-3]MBZ9707794.1 hypothetical protein [Mesorhizobium sp. ESP7-2]UCI22059.1 hypothetical protein FJ970_14345 [Mesorhizobium sp. B2-1-8]
MRYDYSTMLREDVYSTVCTAFKTVGIINVSVVAERIRIRNLAENVALEDIEHLVLQAAQLIGAAIEFDAWSNGLAWPGNDGVENGKESANLPPDLGRSASMQ